MTKTDQKAVSSTAPDDKAFKTLQAELALHGHTLRRTDPTDGPPAYFSTRWGMVRALPTLDDVRAFAAQVSGRQQ